MAAKSKVFRIKIEDPNNKVLYSAPVLLTSKMVPPVQGDIPEKEKRKLRLGKIHDILKKLGISNDVPEVLLDTFDKEKGERT